MEFIFFYFIIIYYNSFLFKTNKKELIEAISWKVSLPDAEIEKVITSFTKVISNKLKKNLVFLK